MINRKTVLQTMEISGRCLWTKRGFAHPVCFSPGGDQVACSSEKGGILVFPVDDPENSFFISRAEPLNLPLALEWSPTSELLAVEQLMAIDVYDLSDRVRLWRLENRFRAHWSPDGRQLNSGEYGGPEWKRDLEWHLLDPITGKVCRTVPRAANLVWSPDGKAALRRSTTLLGQDRLTVLESCNWKERVKIDRRVNDAHEMAWSLDARYVAVGGSTQTFGPPSPSWLVDARSGRTIHCFRQHVAGVNAIAWSPASQLVAFTRTTRESDGRTDVVDVHDLKTGGVRYVLSGPASFLFALHWERHGYRLLGVAYTENGLSLWEWTLPTGAGA